MASEKGPPITYANCDYSRPEPGIVKYRCDYCGGHLGLNVYRYYRMRFCCKIHISDYKQRLTMETRAKIRQLELLAHGR